MSDTNDPSQLGDADATGAASPPVPPTPDDPSALGSDAAATQAFPPAASGSDAEPTQAFPPAASASDAQPTQAYPPAASGSDAEPTQAYPGAYPGAQQYPGQPGYDPAQGAYGGADPAVQQPGAPAARATDTRPRTLAIAALIAAVLGVLFSLGGFIPAPGVATVLVVIGGILLLAAFVLSLVVLISKKQGGKPLGIAALIVSVLGGILFSVALVISLLWIGLANIDDDAAPSVGSTSESSTSPSQEPSEQPSEEASGAPSASTPGSATGTYDEAAYLAAVRPQILAIMQEIQPGLTDDQLNDVYSDETLISLGKSLGAADAASEQTRQQVIDTLVQSSGGAFTEDQAGRFYDTIANAAQQYLVQ